MKEIGSLIRDGSGSIRSTFHPPRADVRIYLVSGHTGVDGPLWNTFQFRNSNEVNMGQLYGARNEIALEKKWFPIMENGFYMINIVVLHILGTSWNGLILVSLIPIERGCEDNNRQLRKNEEANLGKPTILRTQQNHPKNCFFFLNWNSMFASLINI